MTIGDGFGMAACAVLPFTSVYRYCTVPLPCYFPRGSHFLGLLSSNMIQVWVSQYYLQNLRAGSLQPTTVATHIFFGDRFTYSLHFLRPRLISAFLGCFSLFAKTLQQSPNNLVPTSAKHTAIDRLFSKPDFHVFCNAKRYHET